MIKATGPGKQKGVQLSDRALDLLMPLHLRLDASGRIVAVGPTLRKLAPGQRLRGTRFLQAFELRRPSGVDDMASLVAHAGQRLHLNLRRTTPMLSFRGIALPLVDGAGLLVNLSFGIGVVEAVQNHALTDADFAPTDLAVEMLYLVEAKSAVMEELKSLNRRLQGARAEAETRAMTDTLTGLSNRRALDLCLGDLAAAGRPFGLMHVDLDFFKAVNDSFGHAAGDHVLVQVAQALREETRAADLIARVGGDEFVLVFPDLTEGATLLSIAHRLIARITEPMPFDGKLCRVSASIGITESGRYTGAKVEQMLQDADASLYASKRAGRGRALFYGEGGADDRQSA
jgi:diguanylate cyclase (GGDEF)-like protein